MPKTKRPNASKNGVGYGRPPKATRFAKGKSGNPTGRPRGSRSLGAMLNDIMKQKVSVTEGGRERKISALEVMLRRLTNDAMKSDQPAIKLLIQLLERYGDASEQAPAHDQMSAEDEEILTEFLRDTQKHKV